MSRIALSQGAWAGAGLGVAVVVLAVIGLTPYFSWIPELPLLVVAVLLPVVVYGLTGFRVGLRSRQRLEGLLAGAIAGAISGGIGGLTYVLSGKPLLNIVVGLLLGTLGGAVVGALGARLAHRRHGPSL